MVNKEGAERALLQQHLRGRRLTGQRRLLLGLIQGAQAHIDADDLYRLAREYEPRISLSTVYRTLRLFKDLGLVDEHHFQEDHHHYEARAPHEHMHLHCLNCGRIIEFESDLISRLKEEIGRRYNFKVVGTEVHLTGVCPSCRAGGQ